MSSGEPATPKPEPRTRTNNRPVSEWSVAGRQIKRKKGVPNNNEHPCRLSSRILFLAYGYLYAIIRGDHELVKTRRTNKTHAYTHNTVICAPFKYWIKIKMRLNKVGKRVRAIIPKTLKDVGKRAFACHTQMTIVSFPSPQIQLAAPKPTIKPKKNGQLLFLHLAPTNKKKKTKKKFSIL